MITLPETGPAYRIETERMVLRCWNPGDAPLLTAAIGESPDHLRSWMEATARIPAFDLLGRQLLS